MASRHARQFGGFGLNGRWPDGPSPWLTGTCRSILLAPVPAATRSAREFTARALRDWQLEALLEDAALVASELTANAIRHGRPDGGTSGTEPLELGWWRQTDRVTCVVTDASSNPPVLAMPDLGAESGRGLQLVDAVAGAWGWALLGDQRKAVWAALEPGRFLTPGR